MLLIFSTLVLIIHPWQLKTVVFLHRCLLCAVLFLKGLGNLLVSYNKGTARFKKCKQLFVLLEVSAKVLIYI
jgi:hypothetical protein